MLKILSHNQVRELDQFTIEHEPVAAIDLMERACQAFVTWFLPRFHTGNRIAVICGSGNNGGDGLGIVRILSKHGYTVKAWTVKSDQKASESFGVNLKRAKEKVSVDEISSTEGRPFDGYPIIIDALLGSGLSRPVEGIFAQLITSINKTDAIRIAIDIPSGLFADAPSHDVVVAAHETVSFQLPKLAFLFPENYRWVGHWQCVDIGLSTAFIQSASVRNYFVTREAVRKIVRPRGLFSHKGNYGHALIIAGSEGKMGACVLSASAATRSGVGLLTVHVPACGYSIIQTSVPEAMATIDQSEHYFSSHENLDYTAVGVGPGIGTNSETVVALAKLMKQFGRPMVIDADALNILSLNRELLELVPKDSILTPHPKEFERLAGGWSNDFERLESLRSFSKNLKSIVVLKGAFTSIACPDGNIYFNATGNPGMAKAGSGDVLTGLLTALLAQGYAPMDAAVLGVYLHGMAGDIAAEDLGADGMIASDLVARIPNAFQKLRRL